MAGIIQDQGYHDREIAPHIDGDRTTHIGTVGGADRAATLGKARALLHLIGFDEPFGLSVVEALACGTPVIAYRRGSMPELIDDGVTGFLVDTFEEAVAAIGRIGSIDRAACRRAAVERFGVDRMADDYLTLYRSLLGESRSADPIAVPPIISPADAIPPEQALVSAIGAPASGSIIDRKGVRLDFEFALSWMDKGIVRTIRRDEGVMDEQSFYDRYCISHLAAFARNFSPPVGIRRDLMSGPKA